MSTTLATLITDASYSYQTKKGGWAGRMTCLGTRREWWGPVVSPIEHAQDAEMAAVGNTLVYALRTQIMPKNCGWLIQTDNSHVVQLVNFHFEDPTHHGKPERAPKTTPFQHKVVEAIRNLSLEHAPQFILAKHVKGHLEHKDRDRRHHVQEAMDRLAAKGRAQAEGRPTYDVGDNFRVKSSSQSTTNESPI